MLGIEVPIVLAPIIAPVGAPAGPPLAAAVSEAGGLGTIALWLADLGALRSRMRDMKSLTSKPFAINLRLDLDPDARLDACLEEGVRIISMFWGDPSTLAPRAKAAGALLMQTVRSAEEARIAESEGGDSHPQKKQRSDSDDQHAGYLKQLRHGHPVGPITARCHIPAAAPVSRF
ncbi:NAD(P)H-dependent flavin oxidoreductase [Mesorhizobium wenxiniae]|uniref:NAD(P)H-dependent flavin oxidoreductase n=1 Tax=Mesorhizobium wenxiniae TaxID=2014805 RepID=UPI0013FD6B55|nr:nitronate monooxygenase [Mesorhizobium wenxiniae]